MDRTKTFRISLLEFFWKGPLFFTEPSVRQWEEVWDKGWRDRLAPSAPGVRIITGMLLGTGQSHDGSRRSQQLLLLSSFFWGIHWEQKDASVTFTGFGNGHPFSFMLLSLLAMAALPQAHIILQLWSRRMTLSCRVVAAKTGSLKEFSSLFTAANT